MKVYPLRIRADKENPNSFNTCLSNFENIMDPFENEDDDTYFTVLDQKTIDKYEVYKQFGNDCRRCCLNYLLENFEIGA